MIAWGATEARASAITYEYGGVITSADPASGIAPGTRFSGTFTYNPQDLAQSVENEGDRNYLFGKVAGFPAPASTAIDGLALSVGGQSIASLSPALSVGLYESELGGSKFLSGPTPRQTNLNINNGGGTTDNPVTVSLNLGNPNRTVYSTLAMPPAINLGDFTSATLNVSPYYLTPGASNSANFTGTIDTLKAIPAPEPSTMVVLGLGLAGWQARSRFRPGRLHS